MGSIAATTYIKNIRRNVNEPLQDVDILDPTAGSTWVNDEILEALNKAKDDAWDIIRSVREDYFQVTGASVSLVSSTKEYSLASGFRQLKGLRVTTSGYEYLSLRLLEQDTEEFQNRDALPLGDLSGTSELGYCIIETGGTSKIKFCDYPPTALTLLYDYIKVLPDFTLSGSSTTDINDECRRFIEARATETILDKNAADKRLPVWAARALKYEGILRKSVSKREIRESSYVQPYSPY